ncbi:MAG: hypothetical protein H5U36_09485, partial [Candidatus Caldatribacterium sp.]|nr:hypothetical protein [Candidatus Caldatribacterium sp.]
MAEFVTCFGELLIDFFPLEKGVSLEHVSAFFPVPGGAPANVAIALRRLGLPSAFIGKVGDDTFGHVLAKALGREGVNVDGLRFDRRVRTTCVFIALPSEETQEFLFFRNPGADMMLSQEEVAFELLRRSRVFQFGSLSLTGGPTKEALLRSIDFCRSQGVFLSFDVNYRPSLWEDTDEARRMIFKIAPRVELIKLNERELFFLTGASSLEKGIEILAREGVPNLVVTLGRRGSCFWSQGEFVEVEGFAVPVVDTTGCGDSFMAGVLAQIVLRGIDLLSPIPSPVM